MTNPISLSVRVENALSQPNIVVRCDEISRLLPEISNKDAAIVLRRVIESIFGVNGHVGWGIKNVTLTEHRLEFTHLRSFLAATGPLLNLTYRLAHDPFHSFLLIEFPIAYLPARVRADLEDGTAGVFYASKIQNPGPGKVPSHILLNAFEFYMFHFAYFLVGMSSQKCPLSWVALNDALYPVLLEDYLREFLPCDASIPPGPSNPPVSPRGVLMPLAISGVAANLHLTNIVSPITRGTRSPGGVGLDVSSLGGIQVSSPIHHHQQPQSLNVWTSQVVAQIFLEMWVNHSLPSNKTPKSSQQISSASSSTQLHQLNASHTQGNIYSDYTPLEYCPNWITIGFEVFVPSNDHIRVVRMLVKHLHYFSNSIKPGQPSSLDDLKKNLWPMCRKSLYQFLKHMFNHWPLDSSFRLVLETWLSYIQPWRYCDFNPMASNSPQPSTVDADGVSKSVDAQWQSYMAENILFYTLLTEQLLGRLLRLDLSAPKNANILFRLTKVFSQNNFSSFLHDIEDALENSHLMQRSIFGTPGVQSPPSTHLRHHLHQSGDDSVVSLQSLTPLARKSIVDMEGSNHIYVPLFGSQVIQIVNRLQVAIQTAYNALSNELACTTSQIKSTSKGRLSWLTSVLHGLIESGTPSDDDVTIEEAKKTMLYLDTSLNNISAIFNLVYPLDSLPNSAGFNDTLCSSMATQNTAHVPDQISTPSGPVLSSYGRLQLLKGMRRLDLKYEGDPDLRLICSYEIAPLVRWLYAFSTFINNKYQEEIKEIYYRNDFFGRMSRVVVCSPVVCYDYMKGPFGSPNKKVPKQLPPRVSLRFLANKKVFLGVIMVYFMFGVLMGYSTPGIVVKIVFPCLLCYILTKALLSPSHVSRESCSDFNDLTRQFLSPICAENRGY